VIPSLLLTDDGFKVSYKKSYNNGYKYCTRCRAFYKTKSPRCPLCNTILRSNPRKRRGMVFKALEVTPELEKELEKIDLHLKVVRRT